MSAISKSSTVLHEASLERMDEAELLLAECRWASAVYLAGLSVECLLQAIALRDRATDDVRHDLRRWLARCPAVLQATIQEKTASEWSTLNVLWSNKIRYMSESGLLGHLRRLRLDRGLKGGRDSMLRKRSAELVEAARAVHGKGLVVWQRSSRR